MFNDTRRLMDENERLKDALAAEKEAADDLREAFVALSAKLEKAKEAREKAEAMFDECAVARDGAGFIGTVPDCIAFYREATETAEAKLEAAKEAMHKIKPYLTWTIGEESPGYHPTMPSAVAAFNTTLATLEGDT